MLETLIVTLLNLPLLPTPGLLSTRSTLYVGMGGSLVIGVGEDADSELTPLASPLLGAKSTPTESVAVDMDVDVVELPLLHRLSNLSNRVAFAFSVEACVDCESIGRKPLISEKIDGSACIEDCFGNRAREELADDFLSGNLKTSDKKQNQS